MQQADQLEYPSDNGNSAPKKRKFRARIAIWWGFLLAGRQAAKPAACREPAPLPGDRTTRLRAAASPLVRIDGDGIGARHEGGGVASV
jgi:hypothetical protein